MRAIEAMHNLHPAELKEMVTATMHHVTPEDDAPNGIYRTGGLQGITRTQIIDVLGFKPNVKDDEAKVVSSWAFTVDGDLCAIWDYRGSHLFNRWSCYDPTGALPALFDLSNIVDGGW